MDKSIAGTDIIERLLLGNPDIANTMRFYNQLIFSPSISITFGFKHGSIPFGIAFAKQLKYK
jgi:hypothetical protein